MKTLTRQDVEDILYGATIFGAGGGGELSEGFDLLDRIEAAGRPMRLAALDDLPEKALLCTPYLLGAISETPAAEKPLYDGLPQADTHPILIAFDRLQAYLGQDILGTIACELGGSNTAVAFYVAAMNGGVVVDADPAGRAVAEITHSSYYLAGLPAAPVVAANAFGEVMVLENLQDDRRAETVVRALCHVSSNDIAAIDHALPTHMIRDAIMPGTLSKAMAMGALWRHGTSDPATLADKIVDHGNGKVIFEGRVTDCAWRTEAGFTLGSLSIEAQRDTLKIDFKNENMVAWLNGEPIATIPEIITVLDRHSGAVVTNPNATVDQQVSVIVLPAPEIFLTETGLAAFGPDYAGLDRPFQSAVSATVES